MDLRPGWLTDWDYPGVTTVASVGWACCRQLTTTLDTYDTVRTIDHDRRVTGILAGVSQEYTQLSQLTFLLNSHLPDNPRNIENIWSEYLFSNRIWFVAGDFLERSYELAASDCGSVRNILLLPDTGPVSLGRQCQLGAGWCCSAENDIVISCTNTASLILSLSDTAWRYLGQVSQAQTQIFPRNLSPYHFRS